MRRLSGADLNGCQQGCQMSNNGNIYALRGPALKIGREYCDEEEPNTVILNGQEITVEEFRRLRPCKLRGQRMGIYRKGEGERQ
mgnify:CR=1 FL=1